MEPRPHFLFLLLQVLVQFRVTSGIATPIIATVVALLFLAQPQTPIRRSQPRQVACITIALLQILQDVPKQVMFLVL